jgi:hypothetical protein
MTRNKISLIVKWLSPDTLNVVSLVRIRVREPLLILFPKIYLGMVYQQVAYLSKETLLYYY